MGSLLVSLLFNLHILFFFVFFLCIIVILLEAFCFDNRENFLYHKNFLLILIMSYELFNFLSFILFLK